MALTVPSASTNFSEFGWMFHNCNSNTTNYQDDGIMEFSDSSAEYQAPSPQNDQQQQNQVSCHNKKRLS